MKEMMSFYVEPEVREALKKEAERQERSLSAEILYLLKKALREMGLLN